MIRPANPSILYFGTPVILVSTRNADATFNIAPLSSVFWLGWRCVIGVAATSKTTENILRERECVVNMPSQDMVEHIDRLALTTGADPVPETKARRGYVHHADKFARAGLTPAPAGTVRAPRIAECPAQFEARLVSPRRLGEGEADMAGAPFLFELRVTRVWLDDAILMDGASDRVDPLKWRPLLMSFQRFFGLGEELSPSRLATIPERMYRGADFARAQRESAAAT